jgi:ATP-dependent Clp protease protease subunit
MNNNDNHPMAYVPNPFVIQQTARGERSMDIYSRLLEDRIIYVGTEINSVTANLIIAQLLHLENSNPQKEIHMYINSPGGSIYDGLGIYDIMQHISCPVYTYCVGLAASMGSILFTAGHPGHRLLMPNARVMIHQPLGGQPQSQASDIEIRAREILTLKTRLYEIYEQHNSKGLKAKDFIPLCDRDNFLSAEKTLELGLGDYIVKPKMKAKV